MVHIFKKKRLNRSRLLYLCDLKYLAYIGSEGLFTEKDLQEIKDRYKELVIDKGVIVADKEIKKWVKSVRNYKQIHNPKLSRIKNYEIGL